MPAFVAGVVPSGADAARFLRGRRSPRRRREYNTWPALSARAVGEGGDGARNPETSGRNPEVGEELSTVLDTLLPRRKAVDGETTKSPAPKARAEGSNGQDRGRKPPSKGRIQVVTDIDDTVKSSGAAKFAGYYLGGVDSQYRRGDFYPGVFQFALELSLNGLSDDIEPLPMAVLTARARELKFALALEPDHPVCRNFHNTGSERGFADWGVGPVFYGSVKEWVNQDRKGLRKYRNFQLLHNFNEDKRKEGEQPFDVNYVLIGDTGEGDLDAGQMILKKYHPDMQAAFLHIVYDENDKIPDLNQWEDTIVKGVPVRFFRTYVGAARKAVEIGLIDEDAMRRVAARALKDLLRLEPDHSSSKWTDLLRDLREADLVSSRHWLWR